MMKVWGAVLIIGASCICAFAEVKKLNVHISTLENVIVSLDLMRGEICVNLSPMGDVLQKLSESSDGAISEMYETVYSGMKELDTRSFDAIWRSAVFGTEKLPLCDEEKMCLSELGVCLGRYDVNEQKKAIDRAEERLKYFLKKAEEEKSRDMKVHAVFPVIAGFLTVIVLL